MNGDECRMSLDEWALLLFMADYSSERVINLNTKYQQWLSQVLFSKVHLLPLAWRLEPAPHEHEERTLSTVLPSPEFTVFVALFQ